MTGEAGLPAVRLEGLTHRYGKIVALDDVSLTVPTGTTLGLVGADGVGKSTLLSLIAGVKIRQRGRVEVLGEDMGSGNARSRMSRRVAFMPQGLGKNLYPTLSVMENISFHADLFGLRGRGRSARIRRLLGATSLLPFASRAAGKLSGGMKQKLSLCCALIHSPELLILDEPTTGVDPLSRRQFWTLVAELMAESPGMTVMVSTAYIDEAENFAHTVMMDGGRILASALTADLIAGTGSRDLEEAYMRMLPPEKRGREGGFRIPPYRREPGEEPAIAATDLTRRFGSFTAVDHVSFEIGRGEIFGFLGSNGCGKSTTMKMLTGLLEPTSGEARILGCLADAGSNDIKLQVGYMSQAFSLYEELTVLENLLLHAKLYRIPLLRRKEAVDRVLDRFDLRRVRHATPRSLSLGIRQRLQLAAACLHHPSILILDEPTSGVDPAARDLFWDYLIRLSREDRVTIFVSTHFMNEAERCDRISLMHRGRVLAADTPEGLRRSRNAATLEDAFISYLEDAQGSGEGAAVSGAAAGAEPAGRSSTGLLYSLGVVLAFALREGRELLRDPVRMFFVLFGAVVFEIAASYGISFDMTAMPFAVADHDQSRESRMLIREFQGSAYLRELSLEGDEAFSNVPELFRRHHVKLLIDIPPEYGRRLLRGESPEVGFHIDGAFPSVANNVRNYVDGIMRRYNASLAGGAGVEQAPLEVRFMYNEIFRSVYVIVPGLIMLSMVMFPAMMTALGVVREKDLGTISNLYTSPATVLQFLVGKQIPYIILSLLSFLIMTLCAVLLLGVPVRGSFWALLGGAVLMVAASSSFGLLVSCFVRTQVAAIFGSAVLSILPAINFSGFLYPLSTLEGAGYVMGRMFPCSWFQIVSLGSFSKGLGAESFGQVYGVIALQAAVYMILAALLLKKQEK